MNRRDTLKALAVGSVSAGAILSSCNTDKKEVSEASVKTGKYGRTAEEKLQDEKLFSETFFTAAELKTITVLADIIIPKDDRSGSASEAGVPDFIEFIVKDQPGYQLPMRGGLKWLDVKSLKLFNRSFAEANPEQRIELVELIAYPDKKSPENTQGVSFFNLMRNLTATGFFTSKMGIEDMGYMGNKPNAWDGVPDEVLKQYGLEYDAKTLAECLKNEDRGKIMVWDS